MRIVFFMLLFANLAFFGWARWIDTAPPGGMAPAVPTLRLAGSASEAGAAPAGTTAGTAAPAAASAGATSAGPAVSGVTSVAVAGREGVAAPAAAGGAAAGAHCRSMGPFPDMASASAAASAMLTARGLRSGTRSVARTGDDGYWVYLPAIKDAGGRARVLARLRAAGITDAVALVQADHPEEMDRISVGLFRDSDHAQRRADAVKRLGLAPLIEPRQSTTSQYWLDFSLPAGAPDPGIADIGQGQGVLRVADSLRVIDCPAAGAVAVR
jgi:hypothetical protein